jgi:hypothetical protein
LVDTCGKTPIGSKITPARLVRTSDAEVELRTPLVFATGFDAL